MYMVLLTGQVIEKDNESLNSIDQYAIKPINLEDLKTMLKKYDFFN